MSANNALPLHPLTVTIDPQPLSVTLKLPNLYPLITLLPLACALLHMTGIRSAGPWFTNLLTHQMWCPPLPQTPALS